MWMKTEARDAALLSWGSSGGGQKWTFRTQSTNGVSGALRTEVSGGHVVGSTLVADGNWHHVVAVLPQGSSNVSQVLLYVDGFLETTSSTDTSSINTANSSAVKIGSDFSARHFQGLIDEVAIFDRALNGFEIEALSLTTPANGTFDYEAQSTFSVRVRSTDSAGEYVEQDFEITLEDEDEPPTGITLDSNLVPENSPKGTVVGLFAAIDQDIGDRHKFTLVEGEGDGDNANFSISGNSLKTVLPFDYEFQRSHTIRVRAEDSAKLAFESVFEIEVDQVNEPPSAIYLVKDTIEENLPKDTLVGPLVAPDPDNIPADGLILRYTFDDPESLGTESVNNRHAQVHGNVTSVEGKIHGAASFPGDKASYMEDPSIELGGPVSVSTWVRYQKFNS